MGKVVFRVKKISPKTWTLKTRGAFGKKNMGGHIVEKEIGYFPGKDSPYVEDNKDIRRGDVFIFEYNDVTERTELIVNDSNRSLITYLETHPWFNRKFEKFDASEEAHRKLELFSKTEDALTFLRGKGTDEVIALGLLIIGSHSVNMGEVNVLKELKTIAFSNPQRILDVTQNIDFKTLLIGATAFVKGSVTTNDTKTAVVWADNKGVIVRVAKGENPIEKLSEFLVSDTEESRTTLQEMGNRIGFTDQDQPKEEDNKDAEIAALKAQLEALKANQSNTNISDEEETEGASVADESIKELREAYKEKFGKGLAPVKMNDVEWIKAKLAE